MIRLIKKRVAIRNYVWKLSRELLRRFRKKPHYSINEVTQAAERSGLPTSFISYAHAIFCSREDFDAHYGPLQVACTYDSLRAVVSRRYFGGVRDFDAARIINATKRIEEGHFYESRLGIYGAGGR